jgi:hypothetical protein
VDLYVLETPTAKKLQDWLTEHQPHVLHFVGHCMPDPLTKSSALVISNPEKPWLWKATDIPQDLARMRWPFRFVFLNACRSAGEPEQSWSIQKALIEHGVPVIVAMQANINGPYAGTFAAGFYQACAEGTEVTQAVCAGREKLRAEQLGGTYDARDWALPSLTMNAKVAEQGPFHLFTCKAAPDEDPFRKCLEFEDARWFADFRDLRRSVTRWYYPLVPQGDPASTRNALVIVGESTCGKSHLVKWCLETFAFSRPRIRYIRVNENKPKNFLDLLRQIRDGEVVDQQDPAPYSLLHAGLDPQAFRRFNWELNNLLKSGLKGEWVAADHPGEIKDEHAPLQATGENLLSQIFSSFAEALREAAKPRPLLLVFDDFSGQQGERFLPSEEFKAMVRGLFIPLVQSRDGSVKLIFTSTKVDHDYYGLSALPRERVQTLTVQHDFTDDQVYQHAREMFWYEMDQAWDQVAQAIVKITPANLKGLARLSALREMVEKYGAGYGNWVERMR